MVTLRCVTPISLRSYLFLPQGITMDYYSNMRASLGNTGNNYKVVFTYLKDKKQQYLPFNKLYFRILEFYSYEDGVPEIVLLPEEVIFTCLWSVYRKDLKSNNFTYNNSYKHLLNYNHEQRTMFGFVGIGNETEIFSITNDYSSFC